MEENYSKNSFLSVPWKSVISYFLTERKKKCVYFVRLAIESWGSLSSLCPIFFFYFLVCTFFKRRAHAFISILDFFPSCYFKYVACIIFWDKKLEFNLLSEGILPLKFREASESKWNLQFTSLQQILKDKTNKIQKEKSVSNW